MNRTSWMRFAAILIAEICGTAALTLALPAMASWLRIYKDPVHVGWIMSAYLLVGAMSAALIGRLGDIYGRRRVMILILAAIFVGSLVSLLSTSIEWLVAGRAIQGVGGAVLPLAIGLSREHLPAERLSLAIGGLLAAASAGAAVAMLIGGLLIDRFGANSVFYPLCAITLFGIALMATCVPKSKPAPVTGPIDWLGGMLFAPAVAMILIGFSNARIWGWLSFLTLGLILGGTIVLAAWVRHERAHPQPLLDVRLFGIRGYAVAIALLAFAALTFMQLAELALLLLQQPAWTGAGAGLSATAATVYKLPGNMFGMVMSLYAGWLIGRRSPKFAMVLGSVIFGIGAAIGLMSHHSAFMIMVMTSLGAMGTAIVYTAVPAQIVLVVPRDRTSEATGLMAACRAIGQAAGSQLLVILLGSSVVVGADRTRFPSEAAYELVLTLLIFASVTAVALSLAVARRERPVLAGA